MKMQKINVVLHLEKLLNILNKKCVLFKVKINKNDFFIFYN